MDEDRNEQLRKSCDYCARMKRACDGAVPCALCARRGKPCARSVRRKSGPAKGAKYAPRRSKLQKESPPAVEAPAAAAAATPAPATSATKGKDRVRTPKKNRGAREARPTGLGVAAKVEAAASGTAQSQSRSVSSTPRRQAQGKGDRPPGSAASAPAARCPGPGGGSTADKKRGPAATAATAAGASHRATGSGGGPREGESRPRGGESRPRDGESRPRDGESRASSAEAAGTAAGEETPRKIKGGAAERVVPPQDGGGGKRRGKKRPPVSVPAPAPILVEIPVPPPSSSSLGPPRKRRCPSSGPRGSTRRTVDSNGADGGSGGGGGDGGDGGGSGGGSAKKERVGEERRSSPAPPPAASLPSPAKRARAPVPKVEAEEGGARVDDERPRAAPRASENKKQPERQREQERVGSPPSPPRPSPKGSSAPFGEGEDVKKGNSETKPSAVMTSVESRSSTMPLVSERFTGAVTGAAAAAANWRPTVAAPRSASSWKPTSAGLPSTTSWKLNTPKNWNSTPTCTPPTRATTGWAGEGRGGSRAADGAWGTSRPVSVSPLRNEEGRASDDYPPRVRAWEPTVTRGEMDGFYRQHGAPTAHQQGLGRLGSKQQQQQHQDQQARPLAPTELLRMLRPNDKDIIDVIVDNAPRGTRRDSAPPTMLTPRTVSESSDSQACPADGRELQPGAHRDPAACPRPANDEAAAGPRATAVVSPARRSFYGGSSASSGGQDGGEVEHAVVRRASESNVGYRRPGWHDDAGGRGEPPLPPLYGRRLSRERYAYHWEHSTGAEPGARFRHGTARCGDADAGACSRFSDRSRTPAGPRDFIEGCLGPEKCIHGGCDRGGGRGAYGHAYGGGGGWQGGLRVGNVGASSHTRSSSTSSCGGGEGGTGNTVIATSHIHVQYGGGGGGGEGEGGGSCGRNVSPLPPQNATTRTWRYDRVGHSVVFAQPQQQQPPLPPHSSLPVHVHTNLRVKLPFPGMMEPGQVAAQPYQSYHPGLIPAEMRDGRYRAMRTAGGGGGGGTEGATGSTGGHWKGNSWSVSALTEGRSSAGGRNPELQEDRAHPANGCGVSGGSGGGGGGGGGPGAREPGMTRQVWAQRAEG